LLSAEGVKNSDWTAAFLFKAGTLAQPKAVTVMTKNHWRQTFQNENSSLSSAWMIGRGTESRQQWDRQAERAQQRWLNPIEVFVSE
jgi:hypothetical protein